MGRERLLMSVEEHAGGAQLIRVRARPRCRLPVMVGAIIGVLVVTSALDHTYLATALLGGLLAAFVTWWLWEASLATGVVAEAVEHGVEKSAILPRSRRRIGGRDAGAPAAIPLAAGAAGRE